MLLALSPSIPMKTFLTLFGWPHELLHLLALRIIGRRAVSITKTYVDIPEDLSTGEYVFVAGLPALIFWSITAGGVLLLLNAHAPLQFLLGLLVTATATIAAVGTIGDLLLIAARLLEHPIPPEDEP